MELKKVQDYYDELFKLYPDVPKKDIKKIMQFGLKSFLLHNNYGGDVLLNSPSMSSSVQLVHSLTKIDKSFKAF